MRTLFQRSLRSIVGLAFLATVLGSALPAHAQVSCFNACGAITELVDQNGDRITAADQGGAAGNTFTLAQAGLPQQTLLQPVTGPNQSSTPAS